MPNATSLAARRPFPLFIQGVVVGAALALLPVSAVAIALADDVSRDVQGVFGMLAVATILVVLAAVFVFIPKDAATPTAHPVLLVEEKVSAQPANPTPSLTLLPGGAQRAAGR